MEKDATRDFHLHISKYKQHAMEEETSDSQLQQSFASPNSTLLTGRAKVAAAATKTPVLTRILPFRNQNVLKASVVSHVSGLYQQPVALDDFADTASLNFSIEETRDAETIYSIVRLYEDPMLHARFLEHFEGQSTVLRHQIRGLVEAEELPDPDLKRSLSSGELLSQLDRSNEADLTAAVETDAIPAVLYLIHDRNTQRWLLLESPPPQEPEKAILGTSSPKTLSSALNELLSPFQLEHAVVDLAVREEQHLHMYADNLSVSSEQMFILEKPFDAQDKSWGEWAAYMGVGLVLVPIYFLLALGYFDFGGHIRVLSLIPPLTRAVERHRTLVDRRFYQRFTRRQKMLSWTFGIFWICVVLAMIGVGIGVGERLLRDNTVSNER